MAETGINHIKGIIEALLFVSEKPVLLTQLKESIDGVDINDIRDIILQLKNEYGERNSGIIIVEIAGGYQMLTNSDYAMYLKKFYHTRHKEKLTKPSLETLAIIAYKQPVSRQDVELIRGVNSDGVVNHLSNKGLIKITGRKDVPGRPFVYGTTKQFLEYFGLRSLEDLPKLEDFASLQPVDETPIIEARNPYDLPQEPVREEPPAADPSAQVNTSEDGGSSDEKAE